MYRFAQIDSQGICVAETYSAAVIAADDVLDVSGHPSRLGMRWDGEQWQDVPLPQSPVLTQFEKDQQRYQKRAAVKDELMAWMAADNMGRVRSGVWTVADLTALLDDPAVVAANALMGTLSFELAAAQIAAATTPLLTADIRQSWISRLEAHYYLEG